ncbi:MAG: DUF3127 domain-containing protein [Marinifilaceae bacterium]|jgi:hypothetical protein|nr:DUF3127 domain-containing protein [Marinilabiliaceae bacterium JC040]MCT4599308.1 DUF3127 domain-containing protein [Marinifilaceae bacterium]
MNYDISGKLVVKDDVQNISDSFKKREIVLEIENERNSDWNDFIKIQFTQDRCDLIDNYDLNEQIKVSFNLRGRKWEKEGNVMYFTNLEGWRIEKAQADMAQQPVAAVPEVDIVSSDTEVDDLPF